MKLSTYQKLLIIVLFGLVLRLIFFTGTGSSDELDYYNFANQVNHGTFKLQLNHFSFRIGIIYPVAAIFYFFGVNEFTANILVLPFSLASIVLIFFIGKLFFSEKTGLIASLLLSFYPLDVFFSTRLLPDLPAVFFMGLSALFFFYGENLKRQKFYYTLSGIVLGIGYLIKEITLLMGLFYLSYFVYKRKFKLEYFLMGIGIISSVFAVAVFSYYDVNDAFYQYKAHEGQEVEYMRKFYPNYFTTEGITKRIFLLLPYILFTDQNYGLFFIFVAIGTLYLIIKKRKEAYVPIIWMAILALYLNFGTVSLKEYVPFPITVRFLALITIPSLLVLAYFLSIVPMKNLSLCIVMLLLLTSMFFSYSLQKKNEPRNLKLAYSFLVAKNDNKPIYTDERSSRLLDYLYGYKNGDKIIKFNEYEYYDYEIADRNIKILNLKSINDSYIIVNYGMINGLRAVYKDMKFPEEALNPPQNWKIEKQFGSDDDKLMIYST